MQYLTPENFKKTWEESEQYMRKLFTPFSEYERISRNKPHPKIDKAYPKITDGTLASIIQETPKRYIQQIPTGIVRVTGGPEWLPAFINYKLQKKIIPQANCQADVLQKSWAAGSKSMTYGSQPGFVFYEKQNDYFGPNFKLPYIGDVYLEKGKLTDRESNIIFMRSWYQPRDIEAIIEQEKMLAKNAKARDEKYESSWDVKLLKEIKDKIQSKEEKQRTPADKEQGIEQEGVEIIHGFQRGKGNNFYSYSTAINKVVRTKKNKDPRGVIPIHYLYCNIDLSNPLGRSIVEISGGMQNLLDSHTQAFQYIQALEMNPPLEVRGNVKRGTIKYVPNAIWDMGNDPNAQAKPVNINTTAMGNFPNTYGLIKSQILNLNSSMDTSISSEVGNPGFSKTPAGVKSNETRLGVSDNYLRKQYEAWFQDICETALNIDLAETSGIREELLDDDTADKLRPDFPEIFRDPENEDDNTIIVDYDELGKTPIYYEIDASTSSTKDDRDQLENLIELMKVLGEGLPVDKNMALLNKIIDKFGIDDPEDVKFSKEEIDEQRQKAEEMRQQQEMMAQQQQIQGQQEPQGMQEAPGMEQLSPEQEMPQEQAPEMTEDDMQLIEGLQQRGYAQEQVQQAMVMLQQDIPVQEVIQALGAPQGGQNG